ncbi:hypothetical protein D1872_300630 [compost metagenome]
MQLLIIQRKPFVLQNIEQISQTEGENATVPQGLLFDELLRLLPVRLLLKVTNRKTAALASFRIRLGDNVSIFLGRVGWNDTHEGQVSSRLRQCILQSGHCMEKALLHVWVYWKNRDDRIC